MERLKHLLSSKDLTLSYLIALDRKTDAVEELLKTREGAELLTEALRGYRVCNIFIQPSTRTRASSSVSASALGAYVFNEVGTKEDGEWQLTLSSAVKGASFLDEMRTLACYFQLLILRTPKVGMPALAARAFDRASLNVSVINAGDGEGDGEHPTQTLIDIRTILKGLNLKIERDWSRLKNYSVAFINDGRFSRVVRSAAPLLGKVFGMEIKFVVPPGLEPDLLLIQELKNSGVRFSVHHEFQQADIAYVTRIPKEFSRDDFEKYKGYYSVTRQIADIYGFKGVLHPWPRSEEGNELPAYEETKPETEKISLDCDERGWYFKQMENGVPVRAAVILSLLDPALDLKALRDRKLRRGYIGQCIGKKGTCLRLEHPDLGWSEKGYPEALPHLPKIFCPECQPK